MKLHPTTLRHKEIKIMYTPKEIRNARRFLTAKDIDKTGLDDNQIVSTAIGNGYTGTRDLTPAPVQTAPVKLDDLPIHINPKPIILNEPNPNAEDKTQAQLIKDLLDTITPTNKGLPEDQIIELIQKHSLNIEDVEQIISDSTPITTLDIKKYETPTVSIKGAHKELERIVKRLSAGKNVYLYGPAGSGKTTLAKQAAEALSLEFYHTGALLQKYELTGYNDAKGEYVSTTFFEAYTKGGVFLFDEIDASHPQAVIAFNMAIENGEMTFPNGKQTVHPDFIVIAAANTNGQGATANYKRNALDGATIDRFVRIPLAYDESLELRLALNEFQRLGGTDQNLIKNWVNFIWESRTLAAQKKIDVIISPRSSVNGAAILAMGDTPEQAFNETFGASLSEDQKRQLQITDLLSRVR